jgi:hypothetical protein
MEVTILVVKLHSGAMVGMDLDISLSIYQSGSFEKIATFILVLKFTEFLLVVTTLSQKEE